MTHEEMIEMTNTQLVEVHNELAAQCGANDLKGWKNAKAKLIERIEGLQAQISDAEIDAEDDELTSVTVNNETFAEIPAEAIEDGDPEGDGSIENALDDEDFDASVEAVAEMTDDEFDRAMAGEAVTDLEEEAKAAQADLAAQEEKPKKTIKSVAVDLLCHVAYYENRNEKSSDENRVSEDHPQARSVGLAYDEIIRRIQDEFEGCGTSVACLRWYSVKIRVEEQGYEDLRLPQRRPRAKPKTAN
ncbi:hypothetical protein [Roseobacter phage RDJL6]|nr:hypothetical protein [Roseobacter phage RDJL6]